MNCKNGNSSTKEAQFKYCQVCKYNYNTVEEHHVYTKRHKECISKVMNKYLEKINEAKGLLTKPTVKPLHFESEVKVWCYFCNCEVPKHFSVKTSTVCHLGLLSHLKCSNHFKKAKGYFWEHHIDKQLFDQYVLRSDEFNRFLNLALKAVDEYHLFKQIECQNEVKRITEIQQLQQVIKETTEVAKTYTNRDETFICPPTNSEVTKLNIFTGMTPPWLQSDEEATSSKVIGPDISVYQNHLALVKKAKLPVNRVGKDFDRTQTSEDWLPSFGRVWNKGSRTQSQMAFQHAKRGSKRSTRKKPYSMNKYTL